MMAEIMNETVGKDPLQDVFIAKTLSQRITADDSGVSGRIVNNTNGDETNINKRFQNSKNLDNNHGFDNGVITQSPVWDESKGDRVHILTPDTVIWNNSCEDSGLSLTDHFPFNDSEPNIDSVNGVVRTENTQDERASSTTNVSPKAALRSEGQLNKKEKKGISFPKDTFISGYFEPPDPWKNAIPWTPEELINAYKRSCEIHGSKPINKILQQLQALSASGKREELFSLKGEKLDQKQCECIEEIFRRVQFKILDFEACHLDDECATALFDMVEYYESACQLNISCNKNIQARGWQACSRLVRRTPSLTCLDLRNCDLNERIIPIFGRALKLGCHLTILHLESVSLSGRPLVILVAALKMNEILQELFLADNKLMPTDGVQLGNLLRYNHKLCLLDLRNNHLQDVGTSHLCDGLMEQNSDRGLRTLVLWNNQINYQAMPALGRAIAASECLETLNIGHNAITNEGVHLMKDGLLKTNSLLRLGLQGTKISDEGAVALAEYIADSTILLRIDLRENDIKTGGLMALSHAMRVNFSVTRIDLDKEAKKESVMKDYAEQQSRLLRDILTWQERNIQTAKDREEQERKKLEERAAAAAATRQEAMDHSQEIEDNIINESFTVIEEEEAQDKDAVEEKYKKEAANTKLKDVGNIDEVDWSTVEPEDQPPPIKEAVIEKPHCRPSQLFPYKHLHPQETLDSPLATTNENPLMAVVTSSVSVPQTSPLLHRGEKNLLSSIVGASPPEMILSPQYFPKQIARKIFSVSRVDEDPSWPRLSTSPTPSSTMATGFDPLNISQVPLTASSISQKPSVKSSHPPSSLAQPPPSFPILVPTPGSSISQHSKICEPSASPNSSLLQDLAEHSLKLIVSPDVDSHVNLMAKDSFKKVEDPVATGTLGSVTDSLQSKVGSTRDDTYLTSSSHYDSNNCDTRQSSIPAQGKTPLGEDGVASKFLPADKPVGGTSFDSKIVSTVGNTELISCIHESNDLTDSFQLSHVQTVEHNQNLSCDHLDDNVFEGSPEPEVIDSGILKASPLKNQPTGSLDGDPPDLSSLSSQVESVGDSVMSGIQQAAFLCHGAGDVILQTKENLERELLQQSTVMTADVPKVLNHGSPLLTAAMSEESPLGSFTLDQLNTSNSNNLPSLVSHSSEGNQQSLFLDHSITHVSMSKGMDYKDFVNFNNEPCRDNQFQGIPLDRPSSSSEPFRISDSTIKKVNNKETHRGCNVVDSDLENGELSLDDEAWLAVGVENDGNEADIQDTSSKQPDFFTSLSLNGFTQELASALTTLDGTGGYYEEDADLRPHDEFERELDAMLAVVQGDLHWSLKGSIDNH
ncbi:unnamed protein product [Lymnaea stagnalis]|uniref:Protein phosphatase 1 regulatory subunit 37 n=1 Tax=Lymnaea stagnalis TaxID=6523 RepID=A0AAV2H182_LYMST